MRKLLKSRKALSPVVAAIILIAVTVAVSIAVAAWMGALTFTFMATEEVTFTGRTWDPAGTYIDVRVKNTGTATLTIDKIEVNDVLIDSTSEWTVTTVGKDATLDAGEEVEVKISPTTTMSFVSGTKYNLVFITSKGNRFGPYVTTAP